LAKAGWLVPWGKKLAVRIYPFFINVLRVCSQNSISRVGMVVMRGYWPASNERRC